MSSYQAGTASGTILAGTNPFVEGIGLQNLGPNPIYVEVGGTAAGTATGTRVDGSGGALSFQRPPGTPVYVITTVAQVAGADTRVIRES